MSYYTPHPPVGRIAAVKPEKARTVENTLIEMYRSGSFTRMDDKQLVRLLDTVAVHDLKKQPQIKVWGIR